MAQTIGTIILVSSGAGGGRGGSQFYSGCARVCLPLLPLLIKLAIFAGVFYLAWLVFRKLAHSKEC